MRPLQGHLLRQEQRWPAQGRQFPPQDRPAPKALGCAAEGYQEALREEGEPGSGVGTRQRSLMRDVVELALGFDEEELALEMAASWDRYASGEQQQETAAAAKRRAAEATKKARNVAAGDRGPEFLDELVPADEACDKWP
ncbi:hypothetical protein ZWY2020_026802 [Hordeum vulgare]|nr:hypothetical protein ZWY2020_026802 [Hordeum vulgare]